MSFHAEEAKKKANYYQIKEGSFRLKTTKEDPQAVPRPYTNPKTKTEGVAYERVFPALNGIISNIFFSEILLKDGTKLRSLNIKLGEDEEGTEQIATMPEDSRFATDFLAKLPNIDLKIPVRFAPYDFEPEKGPRKVGISILQEGDDAPSKIKSFFIEETLVGTQTKYTNLHGYPEATEEDKSDWPFFYKKVNKFLIKYAQQNILPKLTTDETRYTADTSEPQEAKGEPDSDDLRSSIPF